MDSTSKHKLGLQISNGFFAIATIVVNALANILPINNRFTAEISDSFPNLFVPSGFTFSIWGIIYFLLILFAVYQGRDILKKEKIEMPFLKRISFLFIVGSLANIGWIFAWHYEQIFLSLIFMLILFVSLLLIYLRLDIGKVEVNFTEKIFVHVPFSVYLGWITVATIANVTALLVQVGWDGFGISEMIWTILVLIVGTIIASIIIISRKDIAYGLVIVWAFFGIMIKRINPDPKYGIQSEIAITAGILCIIILLLILIRGFPLLIKRIINTS
jgi:hypothetical protein